MHENRCLDCQKWNKQLMNGYRYVPPYRYQYSTVRYLRTITGSALECSLCTRTAVQPALVLDCAAAAFWCARPRRTAKKILGHRIHAGCLQYQVVWSGNNDREPHYVPQASLLSAQALVTDYWQRLESDQSQQLHVSKRRRLEKEFTAAELYSTNVVQLRFTETESKGALISNRLCLT